MLGFVETYSRGENISVVKSYFSYGEKKKKAQKKSQVKIRKESREVMMVAATAPGSI